MSELREELDKVMSAAEPEQPEAKPAAPESEAKVPEEKPAAQEPVAEVAPVEDPTPAPDSPNVPAPAPAPAVPGAQPAATVRPPASIKPEARADWDKTPPSIQAEFHRRDREVNEALRQTAESRRFHEEFRQTVAPYEMLIRASNSTPLQAVDNLMKTAAALRTSPPPQRAQLVAQIVKEYGVDIVMLDRALSGSMVAPPPDPYVQQIQEQVKPLVDFVSQLRQQQQTVVERTQQEAQAELEEFFANEQDYPYANDLKDDMADILEVSARRGVQLTLQQAYSRASMLHPTISKLVENSGLAQQVAQQNAAAQKARNTAVSVRSAPTGSGGNDDADDDSIRSALEKAIGKSSGRI